jgi:fatty-acid peroxygenase
MVDGFGSVGLRYVRARRARRRADQWATRVIDRTRRGLTEVPADSAVAAIARHLDERGRLLPPHVAGVELLNLLRPTVAVAYFVAFAAHQLSIDDEIADRLRAEDDDALLEAFSHELRRIYPFVPVLAAKVRRRSTFRGARLPRGQRVLLDVYGSLHDPAHWEDVEEFRLDRFCGVEPDPFRYFPQGGGDVARGHRCPGERVAVELLKVATRVLLDAKPSDSRYPIPLRRMPTRPLPA